MTTRAEIVTAARRWLGTPFQHQARVIGEGVDCGGLIVMLAREFHVDHGYIDPVGYPRQPHTDFMERLLDRYTERVSLKRMQPADIVTLAFTKDSKKIHHVGILVEPRRMIHAWNDGDNPRVIESPLRGLFWTGLRRAYKFRGIA